MRASRAYIAGFGMAGSVLACAAVLFVIASAVVAFRGWPKIAGQDSPAALRLNASLLAGSRVARRLRTVVTAAALPAIFTPGRAAARGVTRAQLARRSARAALQRPSSSGTGAAGGRPSGGGTTTGTGGEIGRASCREKVGVSQ